MTGDLRALRVPSLSLPEGEGPPTRPSVLRPDSLGPGSVQREKLGVEEGDAIFPDGAEGDAPMTCATD